ncbi:MAG: hypothetical protein [Olavius algarvensis Delta 4 endosymbiont]|nr:MAG: hypothetical protein [Olavius algarvensis Delta 4 endosymbiont]
MHRILSTHEGFSCYFEYFMKIFLCLYKYAQITKCRPIFILRLDFKCLIIFNKIK